MNLRLLVHSPIIVSSKTGPGISSESRTPALEPSLRCLCAGICRGKGSWNLNQALEIWGADATVDILTHCVTAPASLPSLLLVLRRHTGLLCLCIAGSFLSPSSRPLLFLLLSALLCFTLCLTAIRAASFLLAILVPTKVFKNDFFR